MAVVLVPRARLRAKEEKYSVFFEFDKNKLNEHNNKPPTKIFVCILGIWIITALKEEKIKIAKSLFLYENLNFSKTCQPARIVKI